MTTGTKDQGKTSISLGGFGANYRGQASPLLKHHFKCTCTLMVNRGLDSWGTKVTETQTSRQNSAYHLLVRSFSFITGAFWGSQECVLSHICSMGDRNAKFRISAFQSGARN